MAGHTPRNFLKLDFTQSLPETFTKREAAAATPSVTARERDVGERAPDRPDFPLHLSIFGGDEMRQLGLPLNYSVEENATVKATFHVQRYLMKQLQFIKVNCNLRSGDYL